MNFFGHAVAACWRSDRPAFVLGAMLPDFASMCRGRLAGVDHADIAAGVEYHHTVDRAFHRLPAFADAERELLDRLRARGVGRGPSAGAAHVGVELLLDGMLLDDEPAGRLYPQALDEGRADRLGDSIRWREPEHRERWQLLRGRLAALGLPEGYRDAREVSRRVAQVLSRRPMLALADRDHAALTDELEATQRRLRPVAAALVDELRARVAIAIER